MCRFDGDLRVLPCVTCVLFWCYVRVFWREVLMVIRAWFDGGLSVVLTTTYVCGSGVILCVVFTCDSSDDTRVVPCVTCLLFWCYLRVVLVRGFDGSSCVV